MEKGSIDNECIQPAGPVEGGPSCRDKKSETMHDNDEILSAETTDDVQGKNKDANDAVESSGEATGATRERPKGVFNTVWFVIVTTLIVVGYIFMILGLIVVFMAVGLVVASLVCMLPCIVLPAMRRTQQEGYYVEPSPQQQQLQQQIVETLKPQNKQILTEEQVNQKFPAITYQRAKVEKDRILASENNAATLEEGQIESAEDVVPFDPADRDDTCAICIEDMEDPDPTRILGCNHIFHAECIDTWLTVRRACCPLCKADQKNAHSQISENELSKLKELWNKMPMPSSVKLRRRRRNHRNPDAASRRRVNALRRILERNQPQPLPQPSD
ncbi:hypothetical protein TRICI_001150 [Trichomonascus ciferrii]|uniref:RING-type domain-containing protein n=1 Tax=Trichomonascus ciferrii TaxID=44093 RepID=A0A642V987_9ASCO|nr:hypothetical protein TRICI_001150 [Trichomonascus ciferrii]